MNKYFKYSLITVAVIIVAITVFNLIGSKKTSVVQLQTFTVKPASVVTYITATGTVKPVDQVDVGTQVSGLVDKIHVDFNSIVKKGQLLAELDKTTLMQSVESAQASYNAALNEQNYYESNFTRQQNMFNAGVISRADYEQATYQKNNAVLTVAQRKTALTEAKANLGYANIYSPIDGIIISKEVEEGQTVASMMSTPTLFTIAKDINKMQVEADVDEADIGGVSEGQRVSFTVDAYPDEQFSGKVRQVRLGATITSNVVTYTVIIDADNPDMKLKPGLTATVTIYTQERNNVLTVEVQALNFKPDSTLVRRYYDQQGISKPIPEMSNIHPGKKHVWLIKSDNSIEQREVIPGTSNGIQVEITEGLAENDRVILRMDVKAMAGSSDNNNNGSPFMPRPPKRENKKASAQ